MEKNRGREHRFESIAPPRMDRFQYYHFTPEDFPAGAAIARRIQAESYVNNRIVRPEGLITMPNGTRVLSPDVTNPSGIPYQPPLGSRIEYSFGIEKGTSDLNPVTGRMVAWKRFYGPPDNPLETLPAYRFSKGNLWPGSEQYLRAVANNPQLRLAEPEALGKTENAGPGIIKEFIRSEIQQAFGKGEIWFMGLVEKTVYRSWVGNWGPTAVRQVGDAKKMPHPHMYDDVALVPTVMDIDNFYANMMQDILSSDKETAERLLTNFVYMSEGISGHALGHEVAEFRRGAMQVIGREG